MITYCVLRTYCTPLWKHVPVSVCPILYWVRSQMTLQDPVPSSLLLMEDIHNYWLTEKKKICFIMIFECFCSGLGVLYQLRHSGQLHIGDSGDFTPSTFLNNIQILSLLIQM